MGVYIKGMEMPTNCCGCVFSAYTPTGKIPYCKRTGKDLTADVYFNKRGSSCPLVPVPPHGRLIDATERIKVQIYDDMTEDYRFVEMTIDDLLSQGWVEADAPTIIPAEGGET